MENLITGMQKLNFSGGEPFIHQRGRYVGELTKYCKEELKLPSVSIISNGSLVKEEWFREYGEISMMLFTFISYYIHNVLILTLSFTKDV